VGRVVNNRLLTANELLRLTPPVIFCVNRPDFEKMLFENGYKQISLNLPLAQSLVGLDLKDIRTVITNKIHQILPQSAPVYLTDFEMLFNPQYELDVLRLFIGLARQNKLIIKWRGKANKESIKYAELGYSDYKLFSIKDYDATVVM
jgi:hypothetical protein